MKKFKPLKGSFERSIKLMTTIYQDKGYKSRRDYLESLAEEYNIPLDTVLIIAETYGHRKILMH